MIENEIELRFLGFSHIPITQRDNQDWPSPCAPQNAKLHGPLQFSGPLPSPQILQLAEKFSDLISIPQA
jgi:hypothetical protein